MKNIEKRRKISISKVDKTVQSELDKAAELMEEGAREEVKIILEKVFSAYPSNEEIYQIAIDIYWWGEMYAEAKGLFKRYKEKTGQELKADVSLADLEKKLEFLEKKKSYDNQEVKVFKKIAWWFHAIRKIEVSEQGISFKMINSKTYFYKWPQVKQVILRKIEGGEQGDALGGPSARGLIIQTADGRRYKMRIGSDNQSQALLAEIRNYVKIQRGPVKKENTLIAILVAVLILSAMFIGHARGWEWAIIGWVSLLIGVLYYFFHSRSF